MRKRARQVRHSLRWAAALFSCALGFAAVIGYAAPGFAQSSPPSSGFSLPELKSQADPALLSAPGASAWAMTEQTGMRLLSAVNGVGQASELRLGLQFKMQPGWKIYWRTPGAAGFPPNLDWTGSGNLVSVDMEWPAPQRFSVLGLDTLGYHDDVVFPLTAHLAKPGEPLHLALKVDYLTCKDICIPYTARVSLDLPAAPASATPFAHLIDRFAVQVPGNGKAAGLAIEQANIGGSAAKPVLEVIAQAREPFAQPDLFVEGPSQLNFAAPRITLSDGGHVATLRLAVGTVAKEFPSWQATPLTFTLVDGARSLEAKVTPRAAPAEEGWPDIAGIILVALLGGLILNLMPCVLPVLSLKLLGVVGHGGAERRVIRASFLASAAGVLFSFLLLAGVTIGAKEAGQAVGWGLQFQDPAFLTALAIVCVLFAANLWGLYEIPLPGFLGEALVVRGGHRHGLAGAFVTGAFATVLATPCSAPFLGTAVSFALARGPGEIVAVFVALGLGLALPYLLVAALPGVAQRLPRPGRWMIVLRAILGVALAGTAAWLVWVMIAQLGLEAALVVGVLLAGIPLALWARRKWPDYARRSGVAAVVALIVAAFVLPGNLPQPSTVAGESDAGWQPFAQAQIPSLVAQGRVVFVDVTADWCITCKANKTLVLDRAPVSTMLAAPDVVRMMADWTRPSDEIAAYLASFGRYGIPFNIVYGPGAPAGIPLPELLTSDAVKAAIEKAERNQHAFAN